jgi:hypothetical protein
MHVMTHSGFFPELQDFHSVHDNAPFSAADTGTILYAGWLDLGCPRNNQIFFRFEPKWTETQSVSVVFRFVSRNQTNFFSVCFGVSDRYRNNRNKPKQTEKISKKQISIRVSSKQLIFFRFELKQTETQPVSVVFLFFSWNQTKFFSVCFGVSDRYRNNRNKQNLWYGEWKRFIF